MMNDQWKLSGDCKLCRRKSYCKKPCTANKRRKESLLDALVQSAIARIWKGEQK